MNKNKRITQKELSEALGASLRAVKNMTVSLQSRGYLTRINGKRYGEWVVDGIGSRQIRRRSNRFRNRARIINNTKKPLRKREYF